MEQGLSPEFSKWYEQSPKVRAGVIYLGRDLAEEKARRFSFSLGGLADFIVIPAVFVLSIAYNLDPITGIVNSLLARESRKMLSRGEGVARSGESIYQKEY